MKPEIKFERNAKFSDVFLSLVMHSSLSKLKSFKHKKRSIFNLFAPYESTAFLTSSVANLFEEDIILVTESPEKAIDLYEDISLLTFGTFKTFHLPEIETHPLSGLEVGSISNVERNGVLSKLIDGNVQKKVMVASILSLSQKIPEIDYLEKDGKIAVNLGLEIDQSDLINQLIYLGYERTHIVEELGEFCVRGNLIDVFPVGFDNPMRIDFFGDQIEKLRIFETESQLTIQSIDTANIRIAKQSIHSSANNTPNRFFNGSALDLLNEHSILIMSNPSAIESSLEEYLNRFSSKAKEKNSQEINSRFTFSANETLSKLNKFNKIIKFQNFKIGETENVTDIKLTSLDIFSSSNFSTVDPIASALSQIKKYSSHAVILVSSTNIDSLKNRIEEDEKWKNLQSDHIFFQHEPLNNSFGIKFSDDINVVALGDKELFGISSRNISVGRKIQGSRKLSLLDPGSLVVHEDHGIAKFIGVTNLKGHGDREYLELHYADKDKLFVPADQISRIDLYKGGEDNTPKLNRLHGKEWEKQKQKVKESTEILAAQLLELHSSRKKIRGFSFQKNNDWQLALETSFPFNQTPDQESSMKEIYQDMEKNNPMDRLLCGDVGFGKTELAIRASFKAVQSGKQVAVLVPTTVLAEQHYETFKSRMSPFPVTIESLSRLRSNKEIEETKKNLKEGSVDVCIGTHRMLQRDVKFKNLGLYIVDEEHKFGVRDKEFLKKLRLNLDILSLSATPIPRTMNLALSGVRDLSLIETAPMDRQAVKTYTVEESEKLIREVILREKDRNGQVFVVFNRVNKIKSVTKKLRQLVPEAKITFAHGRMGGSELSKVMRSFSKKLFDVLVCTTIIESGIDMPDVNTIIILNPHQMGLAQLYQLRGRVGRSKNQAYAYFMVPKRAKLTEETEKRLEAITRFQYLGAGREIATRDMQIRGVGNVLGKEQSGNVNSVGLGLYMKFLATAVTKKNGELNAREDLWSGGKSEVNLDLHEEIGIPQDYIPDLETRLQMYSEISALSSVDQVESYLEELIDRFGQPPCQVSNLLNYQKIKIIAQELKINSIKITDNLCVILFDFTVRDVINFLKSIFPSDSKISDKQIRIPSTLQVEELTLLLNKALELKKSFNF